MWIFFFDSNFEMILTDIIILFLHSELFYL